MSKRQGIEKLLDLMNWKGAEVFAIGDEINDLPMLKAFNGFTVDTARKEIQRQVKNIFSGVGEMLIKNI